MFKNSLLVSLYCVQEVGGEFFVEEVDGVSSFRRLRSGCEVDALIPMLIWAIFSSCEKI